MVQRPLRPIACASLLLGLLLLALGGISVGGVSSVEAQAEAAAISTRGAQPNIILILADDLDQQLDTLDAMPYLKSLVADQGTTFENAFVPLSLCCPSRASLLRGQYPHNHRVYANRPPYGGWEKFNALGLEETTIAIALQAAGYRTVLLGKYLNGYPAADNPTYVPPGWDEWYSPARGTPYSGFNYQLNENGTLVPYGATPDDYFTDVMRVKAVDFISRAVASEQPFFMFLNPYAPHSPATPAPRHAHLFPNAQAPRLPSFNEADVSDKPSFIQSLPLLDEQEIEAIDQLHRRRLQSLQAVDEAIATLIGVLEEAGQLQNTYIVLTSDNGYHLGEHRLTPGKYTAYEEDVRVPLIVRGPGVPAGRVRPELVSTIDLAPMFAQVAGLDPLAFSDGRSLLPLLSAPPVPAWRQVVLLEQYPLGPEQPTSPDAARAGLLEPPDGDGQTEQQPDVFYAGLRTATYQYVEYGNGERELYDLTRDPYQLQNVFALAAPAFVDQLSTWLALLSRCEGSTCRVQDAQPPPVFALIRNVYLPLLAAP